MTVHSVGIALHRMANRKSHTYGRTDCCIVGCEREAVHGVCEHHRTLYRLRTNTVMNGTRTPEICLAFLRARCHMVGDDDPCWEPDCKAINLKGYVWVSFLGNRKVRGHRLAYRLQHIINGGNWDDLQPTDYVLHSRLCERRFAAGAMKNKCWNPAHLRVGSNEENLMEQWENRREMNPGLGTRSGSGTMCEREGCEKSVRARGLCDTHYQQWRRKRVREQKHAEAAAATTG